jgi:hypothetical protein
MQMSGRPDLRYAATVAPDESGEIRFSGDVFTVRMNSDLTSINLFMAGDTGNGVRCRVDGGTSAVPMAAHRGWVEAVALPSVGRSKKKDARLPTIMRRNGRGGTSTRGGMGTCFG